MSKEKEIAKYFGSIVRELRRQKNISQEKLAEIGDLDRSYISEVENGYKTPTIITVTKIAGALDTRPSRMLHLMEQQYDIEY